MCFSAVLMAALSVVLMGSMVAVWGTMWVGLRALKVVEQTASQMDGCSVDTKVALLEKLTV